MAGSIYEYMDDMIPGPGGTTASGMRYSSPLELTPTSEMNSVVRARYGRYVTFLGCEAITQIAYLKSGLLGRA